MVITKKISKVHLFRGILNSRFGEGSTFVETILTGSARNKAICFSQKLKMRKPTVKSFMKKDQTKQAGACDDNDDLGWSLS
ncbi:MAG TPA: hypothetical protein PLT47_08220 [Bacteroidales bacterium]|nr:hypothetical protein [Bacteroidales bacterium]HQI70721.1 hypothetical protein [Bacteroidales bacterium]